MSTEFFFYVTYIVLVLHVARMRSIAGLLVTAGAMSVLVLTAYAYAAGHRNAINAFAVQYMNQIDSGTDHSVYWWFFYYSPYGRVFEFILGCLTAQIYASVAAAPGVAARGALGADCYSTLRWSFSSASRWSICSGHSAPTSRYTSTLLKQNFGCAVGLAVLIFCVSRYRSSTVALMLSTPLMVQLGDLSFSIYAVHTWTLRIFERPSMDFRLRRGIGGRVSDRPGRRFDVDPVERDLSVDRGSGPRLGAQRRGAAPVTQLRPARSQYASGKNKEYSADREIVLGTLFVAMIGALLVYQFLIVPYFTPYVR